MVSVKRYQLPFNCNTVRLVFFLFLTLIVSCKFAELQSRSVVLKEEDHEQATVLLEKINKLNEQGKYAEAILSAEKSLKFADETRKTDILLYLAELYEEIDEDRALHMYSQIYKNSENSRKQRDEALMRFGNLSLMRGDRQTALNTYAKIINGDSDSTYVLRAKNKISTINVNTDSSFIKIPED